MREDIEFTLLRYLIDLLEKERYRNTTQDLRICNLEMRVDKIEKSEDRQTERLEFLEAEIPNLRYRVDRSLELEWLENPYSLEGEPRCDF